MAWHSDEREETELLDRLVRGRQARPRGRGGARSMPRVPIGRQRRSSKVDQLVRRRPSPRAERRLAQLSFLSVCPPRRPAEAAPPHSRAVQGSHSTDTPPTSSRPSSRAQPDSREHHALLGSRITAPERALRATGWEKTWRQFVERGSAVRRGLLCRFYEHSVRLFCADLSSGWRDRQGTDVVSRRSARGGCRAGRVRMRRRRRCSWPGLARGVRGGVVDRGRPGAARLFRDGGR